MGVKSKIQWTDHTLNFWTGCKKVSPGCKYCYMYRDKERYGKEPTEVVKVRIKTINKVLREAKPGERIFTCSWSDFFIKEADQWREAAWDIIKSRPDLHWQILTKRPERIQECLPYDWGLGWDNVWLGVSVENDTYGYRIPQLAKIPAAVRFLSVEPMIGPVLLDSVDLQHIHWVIIGGESGNDKGKYRYRPCNLNWINQVIERCQTNGTPVFVKQLGTFLSKEMGLNNRHGGDIDEWPESIRVREMPFIYSTQ